MAICSAVGLKGTTHRSSGTRLAQLEEQWVFLQSTILWSQFSSSHWHRRSLISESQ